MPQLRRVLRPIVDILRRTIHPTPPAPSLGRTFAEQDPTPAAISTSSPNRLEQFFDQRKRGPGIWKWRHYFEVYDTFLSPFVGKPVRILEIGVYSGGSLDMWRDYFGPTAHVTGIDIQPVCMAYARDGVEIIIGNQGSPEFWDHIRATKEPFDVVIDDGSHDPQHQATTLKGILSHINPGGVYLCEDIQGPSSFGEMIGAFSATLHEVGEMRSDSNNLERRLSFRPSPIQQRVHSLHVYPMVAVIQKRHTLVEEFVGPMHGTQWQPTIRF